MAAHCSPAVYTAVRRYCTERLNAISRSVKRLSSDNLVEVCTLLNALKVCNEERNTHNVERCVIEGALLQELGKAKIDTSVIDDLLTLLGFSA